MKKPHSNIYELIDVFKREQAATEATYQQLETGVIPPECRRKSTGNWSRGFSRKNDRLSAGQVSIREYAIGHLVGSTNSSNTCTFKCN